MTQERYDACQRLIRELLDCPGGTEEELLQANKDLLDGELFHLVGQEAQRFEEGGDQPRARFLRDLAGRIADILGFPKSRNPVSSSLQKRLALLNQMLQAIMDTRQAWPVHQLMEANPGLLDGGFVRAIHTWVTEVVVTVRLEAAHDYAKDCRTADAASLA